MGNGGANLLIVEEDGENYLSGEAFCRIIDAAVKTAILEYFQFAFGGDRLA